MVIRTFPQSYPDEWGSNSDSERAAGARSAATTPRAGGSGRPLTAVVLAAGEGTRMRSARPKPLHRLCGRPMVLHVLDALAQLPVTDHHHHPGHQDADRARA